MSRLLFEIGTEAIPAGYLAPALEEMRSRAAAGLAALRLEPASVVTRGTPMRLVLEVDGLPDRQPDVERTVHGPRVEAAFRDGQPTRAAEGFARKNGVAVEDLQREETDKGTVVVARVHEAGRPAVEVLSGFLGELTADIPWPKTMRWSADGFLFPRPIRWITALLDDAPLSVTIAGIAGGCATRGHRLIGPGPHEVPAADDLEEVLRENGVILDPADRRAAIERGLRAEAERLGGGLVEDEGLLDEVVFLVEHPRVLSGSFDEAFLAIPREVTVTAMRSHQRYFAAEREDGSLLPNFLVVADGDWKDPSDVIAGNERVLRARLADARFYWDVDLRTGLDGLAAALGSVVWLEGLGSVRDKAERVAHLVDALGAGWRGDAWAAEREPALRAARLAKADLASEMIKDGKEFTGLQGVIGARYGEALGEPAAVTAAIAEQYLPKGADDPLPATFPGTLLALADRLDTLVGVWAAGFVPTGSQDPYALRRAANGVVRILLEQDRSLSLRDIVSRAVAGLPAGAARSALPDEVLAFLRDRIAYFLREEGIPYDVVDAVLVADADDPVDARARARALQAVRGAADLEPLVIGFKRAANILKGVDTAALPDPGSVDWAAAEPAERTLHEAAAGARDAIAKSADPGAVLRELLTLRGPIDGFFDGVMVMADDPAVRDRRLALLAEVRALFDDVCDLSRIVIEG